MLKVKICGITNLEDALLAIELGADALGFIFAPSPRRVEVEKAKEIISNLPPFVISVGVFVDEEIAKVQEISHFCQLDAVQFHGDESPEYCRAFSGKVIKAFRISCKDDLKKTEKYEVSAFLLDSPQRGKPFDWTLLRDFSPTKPVILAGGLNADNIEHALEVFRPYAVDVSSGVEAYPGKKDKTKLANFMEVIHKWRKKAISELLAEDSSQKP